MTSYQLHMYVWQVSNLKKWWPHCIRMTSCELHCVYLASFALYNVVLSQILGTYIVHTRYACESILLLKSLNEGSLFIPEIKRTCRYKCFLALTLIRVAMEENLQILFKTILHHDAFKLNILLKIWYGSQIVWPFFLNL